jgi:hypothetical protein
MTGIHKLLSKDLDFDSKFSNIKVSFFEIFGDCVSDLLNNRQSVSVRNTTNHVFIQNLSEFDVANEEEFLRFVETGLEFRKSRATEKNQTSSRSHAVFAIQILPSGYTKDKEVQSMEGLLVGKYTLLLVVSNSILTFKTLGFGWL